MQKGCELTGQALRLDDYCLHNGLPKRACDHWTVERNEGRKGERKKERKNLVLNSTGVISLLEFKVQNSVYLSHLLMFLGIVQKLMTEKKKKNQQLMTD